MGGTYLLKIWARGRRLRIWNEAVTSCGMSVEETSRASLKARAGEVEVQIESFTESRVRIVSFVPWPLGPLGVRIYHELRVPSAREIEIGDEPFDSTFSVEGSRRLVCALLDAEVRRLLLSIKTECQPCQLTISDGRLQAELPDHQIRFILPVLLDLRQRLVRSQDVTQRLVDNALRDPVAGVRLQNLMLLVRELRADPKTIEVLRTACSDASPQVRLWAAMELGAEGLGAVIALAESLEDDACCARAVSALGPALPIERTRNLLVSALRRRCIVTAGACLKALGRDGGAADVGVLAKVLAREGGELAAVAAAALGSIGCTAAEPPLILALKREETEVRTEAASALGRVGSVPAVLPLKEAAERFSDDLVFGRAARQAIAEIHSRLPGASPGQLSLAGAEVGQLSLAQAAAGQLSLATDSAGQLSFPSREPGQLSLSGAEEER
jgi:hypothetical protein